MSLIRRPRVLWIVATAEVLWLPRPEPVVDSTVFFAVALFTPLSSISMYTLHRLCEVLDVHQKEIVACQRVVSGQKARS